MTNGIKNAKVKGKEEVIWINTRIQRKQRDMINRLLEKGLYVSRSEFLREAVRNQLRLDFEVMMKEVEKFGPRYYELDSSHELRQRALERQAWLKRNGYQVRMKKGILKYIDSDDRARQFIIYRIWKWKEKKKEPESDEQ